jgi:hypothetical protein
LYVTYWSYTVQIEWRSVVLPSHPDATQYGPETAPRLYIRRSVTAGSCRYIHHDRCLIAMLGGSPGAKTSWASHTSAECTPRFPVTLGRSQRHPKPSWPSPAPHDNNDSFHTWIVGLCLGLTYRGLRLSRANVHFTIGTVSILPRFPEAILPYQCSVKCDYR